VETSPTSHGGSYHAFCKGSDGGAYQITNYQMQTNDQVTLSWWAEHTGGSGSSTQIVNLISAPSQTSAYSSATVLTSTSGAVNGNGSSAGPWTQYTLTYKATANDAGNFVGVFFNNTTSSNWSGFDDFSISVLSAPYPPSSLSATDGNTAVALNWSPSANATSYNVKRAVVSGSYSTIAGVSGTTYNDTPLSNGTTYYYVVSAVNNVGEGANSDPVTATPSLPVTLTESNSGQFSLAGASGGNVTVIFNGSVPGHTYTIQYCANITQGVWTNVGTAIVGTGGNIQFPPMTISGTQGFYRILIQRE